MNNYNGFHTSNHNIGYGIDATGTRWDSFVTKVWQGSGIIYPIDNSLTLIWDSTAQLYDMDEIYLKCPDLT